MRLWRWVINDTSRQIIAQSLASGPELFQALDRVEQTIDGYPQDGTFVTEDVNGEIVRWHVAGYELLYERKVDTMYLLMADIQRK